MPLACIHTHTTFCDGSDEVETFCRMAHSKGLVSVGFSAHAPITRKTGIPSSWNLSEDKLPLYIEEVKAAQKRWQGKLPVYLGLEVDFIPGLIGPADRDFREMDLDYIIAAVHYVIPPRGEPFTVDDLAENVERGIKESYGGDPAGIVKAYWNSQEALIRSGGFDVLAHPDLIKKNYIELKTRGIKLFSEDDDFYREKTANVAALMAEAKITTEVNTGGLNRGKTKDCYPSANFLKLFRKHGVQMVINADAHKAEDLDGHYAQAREAMLAAGYSETTLFAGRKNGRAVWNSVKL